MSRKFRLKALDSFTCIGGDCPENCCKRNWRIDLDEDTYRKWQKLDNNNIAKARIMDSIITSINDGKEIKSLKRDENNGCYHLTNDALCSIQQQLGEDMMPSICREYPRINYNTKKRDIQSATLSCPEIARLVLFSDDKYVYHIKGESPRPIRKGMTPEKVYWYLDRTANNVFAAKDFPLNIKLTYLARVLAEITLLGSKGALTDDVLKSFSSEYQLHMSGLWNAVSSGEFGTSPANARYMWHVILTALAKHPEFNEKLGLSDSIEELVELHKSSDGDKANNDPFYQRIRTCKLGARSAIERYQDALKRYLQTVFVSKSFPWRRGDHGYVDAFLECLIPFAAVQLVIWLFTDKHQQISEKDMIAIINGIEGRFGHNSEIIKNIENNKDFHRLELYFDWFLDVA